MNGSVAEAATVAAAAARRRGTAASASLRAVTQSKSKSAPQPQIDCCCGVRDALCCAICTLASGGAGLRHCQCAARARHVPLRVGAGPGRYPRPRLHNSPADGSARSRRERYPFSYANAYILDPGKFLMLLLWDANRGLGHAQAPSPHFHHLRAHYPQARCGTCCRTLCDAIPRLLPLLFGAQSMS